MRQVAAVRLMHNVLGGTIDPHAAWLVLRGIKTLHLRVKQQNASAMTLATRLEAHPKIAAVHYPGALLPCRQPLCVRTVKKSHEAPSLQWTWHLV